MYFLFYFFFSILLLVLLLVLFCLLFVNKMCQLSSIFIIIIYVCDCVYVTEFVRTALEVVLSVSVSNNFMFCVMTASDYKNFNCQEKQ